MAVSDYTDIAATASSGVISDGGEAIIQLVEDREALATLNSSATAPTVTKPNMLWLDTSTGLLYQRDNSDTKWTILSGVADDRVVTKTVDYNVVLDDYGKTLLVDASGGDVTITLVASATAGANYTLKIVRTDTTFSNLVTIDGNSAETVGGSANQKLFYQNDSMEIVCDGSSWKITGKSIEQPETRIISNANQSILDETLTKLSWQTEYYDRLSAFDSVSDSTRLTIHQDGRYRVEHKIDWADNSVGRQRAVFVFFNGVSSRSQQSHPAHNSGQPASYTEWFSAGDYIELYAFQDSGGALDILTGSSITLIKEL